jgi:hypothetical protein
VQSDIANSRNSAVILMAPILSKTGAYYGALMTTA